jgi:hypothetical protein
VKQTKKEERPSGKIERARKRMGERKKLTERRKDYGK